MLCVERRMPVLLVQQLSKSYDGKHFALNGLNMQVERSEVVGLIGPNGSGKTTALSIIAGIRRATAGAVYINGFDIAREPIRAKQFIGYVPDDMAAVSNLTGWEYVSLTGTLYGLNRNALEDRAQKLFDLFGLIPHQHQLIETYSHGMLRKTLLIAALVHAPDLLILDEPLSGLDVESILISKRLVRSLASRGTAFLVSTHQLELAEEICDRVYMLRKGGCIASGTPQEILTESQTRSLADAFIKLASDKLPDDRVIDEIADYR